MISCEIYEKEIVLQALRCHTLGVPKNREIVKCSACPLLGQGNCVQILLKNCFYYINHKEE